MNDPINNPINNPGGPSPENLNQYPAGNPVTGPMVIPVIAEQVLLDKKVVEAGRVRVSKTVNEYEEMVRVPFNREEVQVERVAVNQYVDTPPPAMRYEGATMIIPVVREVVVVEKKLLVVEELWVTKRQVQTEEVQPVTLRQEEVQVERITTPGDHPQQPVNFANPSQAPGAGVGL